MNTIGWVDLNHILDLYAENRKLEWLTSKDINELLRDKENRIIFWNRSKECQNLFYMVRQRDEEKRAAMLK
jgi:hypothetical protein